MAPLQLPAGTQLAQGSAPHGQRQVQELLLSLPWTTGWDHLFGLTIRCAAQPVLLQIKPSVQKLYHEGSWKLSPSPGG